MDFRKILWVACAVLLAACSASDRGRFRLEGEITGAAEGELIRLSYPVCRQGTWYSQTDSARVENGRFRFEGEVPGIVPASLDFDNMDEVCLYLEPSRIRLRMERDRLYGCEWRGLSVGMELDEYRNWLGEVPQRLFEKSRWIQATNQRWADAAPDRRDSLWGPFMEALQAGKAELVVEDSLRMAYLEAHPDRTIAPQLLYRSIRAGTSDSDRLRALYGRIPETAENRILRELAGIQLSFAPGEVGYEVGDRAYAFERCEVAGGPVRLSDYAGSVVLLDFWASWCGPCLKAAPAIREAARKYADQGLQVIGLSVDDDPEAWRRALTEHGLDYCPQVLSCESGNLDALYFPELADLSNLYQVMKIPCLILIDREGRIAARWQRITPTEEAQLETVLCTEPSQPRN